MIPNLLIAKFGYLVGGDYINKLPLNYLNSVWADSFPVGDVYEEDADRMLACSLQAMQFVKDKLFIVYDFSLEYTLTGIQRNQTIVRLVSTFAAYYLAKRDDSVSKDLLESYDASMKDIGDYMVKNISIANLPSAPSEYKSKSYVYDGSSKYFY